ncbi:hypothetical protein KVH22_14900 [Streptomyces olivaceus]|uniref:hypothetical protein n=1 Tax=Streptomyces olivaceus TaxID=47716 RepID=UPI001CCB8FB0|nr:hypothetical protein [Streptomyces olivaceus]MBZ6256824.1 hypothetical protein [Streptomyces olivaceus]
MDEPHQVATKALRARRFVFGGRVVVQDGSYVIEQQRVDVRGSALHLLQGLPQAGLVKGVPELLSGTGPPPWA